MKVISVNRGEVTTINYQGTEVKTGIFKYPVDEPIYLGETDVVKDSVVDRRFHGGIEKAVYAYSLNHYSFWKEQFPDLVWDNGMFGENLTIEGLDESKMFIGSVYQVGEAQIQVSQPRQPCFKLGIRFKTQSVLRPFVNELRSGVYFRVLKPGKVKSGDVLELLSEEANSPSIADVYQLMYHKQPNSEQLVQKIVDCEPLPSNIRAKVQEVQA